MEKANRIQWQKRISGIEWQPRRICGFLSGKRLIAPAGGWELEADLRHNHPNDQSLHYPCLNVQTRNVVRNHRTYGRIARQRFPLLTGLYHGCLAPSFRELHKNDIANVNLIISSQYSAIGRIGNTVAPRQNGFGIQVGKVCFPPLQAHAKSFNPSCDGPLQA